MTVRERFEAELGFPLDAFQVRALDALDEGKSVLVAAPTGSGKTVVGEYAIDRALDAGGKAFYTTPLKALSNQKYGDLLRRYGAGRVGLLTGDNSINANASVVVMTTEVLRNMIYARSDALIGLRAVILDEVHYLQNPYRGAVWEEVIVHTPQEVDLVCLSATVSNAEEFASWIHTVRGATEAVIEERRPVELHNLYLVGDRSSESTHLMPTLVDDRPNPEAVALDRRSGGGGDGERGRPEHRHRARPRLYTPRRAEVAARLDDGRMLPAIYFIFSRAACDDAVRQCLDAGLRFTTPEDRERIRSIAEDKVEGLSDDDLRVLGYGQWLSALESGIAAHHAGMVPPFKEAVEACFAEALVKLVFATETLSLGINMPARTVVIEKLSKFTGERHEFLTPGEYTQLTGRAGRRGIDNVGYAVVLHSPYVPFEQVASLVSRRTYALSSSFRPTYNMAVNLVRRYAPDEAHHLLNLSFAQFQTDAEVVRLERHLARAQQGLEDARARARCELGDIEEYRRLLRDVQQRRVHRADKEEIVAAMGRVRPGDVIGFSGGRAGGRVAVLATPARRGGDVRLRVVTTDRRLLTLGPSDFPVPPRRLGRVELPSPYMPNNAGFRRAVADALQRVKVAGIDDGDDGDDGRGRRRRPGSAADAHPVAGCPDVRTHIRAAERAGRLANDVERLTRQVKARTESLARQFDRVLRVLEAWGYVDGWALTPDGERLARLYHEADLLVAECLRSGLFDGLDAAEAVALASVFTYETRGLGEPASVAMPGSRLRDRWRDIEHIVHELHLAEEEAGLPLTRPPDPGFVAIAHGWAAGVRLDTLLGGDDVSGGDFVRNVKQLLDLVRQLADSAADPTTARALRSGADGLFRGVVAASSTVPS